MSVYAVERVKQLMDCHVTHAAVPARGGRSHEMLPATPQNVIPKLAATLWLV